MNNPKSHERVTDFLLSFEHAVEIHGYRVSDNSIEFFGEDGHALIPSFAAVGSGYERASGKFKSTSRVVADPRNLQADIPNWVARYDSIFGVDTNTVELDDQVLSVTCIFRADIEFVGLVWNATISAINALVFVGPKFKPELIGWLHALSVINVDPLLKVCLVVDSELGALPEINLRTRPIESGIYLPNNVELVYASADHDKNVPFNLLISTCDSHSTKLIEKIRNDRARLSALKASSDNQYVAGFEWPAKASNAAQPTLLS
jgi:hypothetical protein